MKNLLTLTGSMMVLLTLLAQFVHGQQVLLQTMEAERVTTVYCKEGDMDGLRDSLSRIMGCERNEVQIETEILEREGKSMKTYRVDVPVEKILVSPKFWGIDENRNHGWHRIEREVPYE